LVNDAFFKHFIEWHRNRGRFLTCPEHGLEALTCASTARSVAETLRSAAKENASLF
jgi:hypothetical protein